MSLVDNIVMQADVALNDSDKTFTVPAGKLWCLKFLQAKLISTATVGNRQMRIEIGDGTNLLWYINFGTTQAASLTRYYYAAADLPNDVAFSVDKIRAWMLTWVLPAGYTIRLYDSAAIAAGADDLEFRLLVEEIKP